MSDIVPHRPLVITTCSASKRCRSGVGVSDLPRGAQKGIVEAWLSRISDEHRLVAACDLYSGRAFGIASRAAGRLGADLSIISAGLGYIRGETLIPSYDLTIRPTGLGSIARCVDGDFDVKAWWRSVSRGHFASDLVADVVGRPLVLMCLSRAYAKMIEDDILMIAAHNSEALRIFGLSIGSALPGPLRFHALPYDERLSSVGAAGTRVDFPQRALSDYVDHVAPQRGNLHFDISAVESRMLGAGPVDGSRRQQRRVDDSTLRRLIVDLLPEVGPGRVRLLRHIRHEKGLSCEQQRFSRLYDAVREEMQL